MKRCSLARVCSVLLIIFVFALMPVRSSAAAVMPAKVKNFRLICNGDKSAFLAWNKAKDASYYLIYRYDASKKKYVRDKKTTETNCRVRNLKVGKKYKFVVQSVHVSRKGVITKSPYSKELTVKGKRVNVQAVHGRRWAITVTRGFKAKDMTTGKTVNIKAGTSGVTTASSPSVITLIMKKGKKITKVRTSRYNVRYGNLVLTKSYKYYSKAQAEAFINQRGYSSETKWLFWISQYTGSFHLFKGAKGEWKQVRSGPCVIGTYGHTRPGIFRFLKYGTASGRPSIYFYWNGHAGLAIHCRMDSNITGAHSSGCIRLGDDDLYFVKNHCPLGTTVLSY